MIIGVMSDTHGHLTWIEKAIQKLENCDVIIHLGDNDSDAKYIKPFFKGEVYSVRGNCDFASENVDELTLELGGKKLLVSHGHRYNVKTNLLHLKYKAMETGVDIALFGHSHIPVADFEEGILLLNPGSVSLGKTGFNSVAKIEILGDKLIPLIVKI